MYGVRQMYYDTGKTINRILSESEVANFLSNEAQEFKHINDQLYFKSYRMADIYIDLFDSKEKAEKFYQECITA